MKTFLWVLAIIFVLLLAANDIAAGRIIPVLVVGIGVFLYFLFKTVNDSK